MDLAAAVAALVFVLVVTLIVGLWWYAITSRTIRARLGTGDGVTAEVAPGILKVDPRDTNTMWGRLIGPLATLTEQAGYDIGQLSRILSLMGTFAAVAGGVGWLRTGGVGWGMFAAPVAGSLPVLYLLYKRYQRLQRFEKQFPEGLDMMTRSIRAGYALSGAIQAVAEEMPDPVGQEFERVFEETRLGMDPGEALSRLQRRVPTEDAAFFCSAIAIQRSAGGNLAEILECLSEVIRERFKILSHARVLSVQHKWTAICVGLFPVFFAILFEVLSPGYFEPLFNSPLAPYLIGAALILEAIGFFTIWRFAQIRV